MARLPPFAGSRPEYAPAGRFEIVSKLIYDAFTSLDGYVADENGNFDWAELDEEVYAFINNRERQIGTYLFGRKLYETMAVWETPDVIPHLSYLAWVAAPYIPGSPRPTGH